MKLAYSLILAPAFFCASCGSSTARKGESVGDKAALAAGVGTMAVLSPLAPVVGAINRATLAKRPLRPPEVFKLADGRFAISNEAGWFTDRSEMPQPGKGWIAHSAWLIDVHADKRDSEGRIVLSEHNLDRWFLRDHSRSGLQRIGDRAPQDGRAEYFVCEPSAGLLTLFLGSRDTVTVFLTQE